MSLIGIRRLIRHRWPLLVVGALIGGFAAYFIVGAVNRSIKPAFEAVALVTVEADDTSRQGQQQTDTEVSTALAAAVALANEANTAVIESQRGVITGNSRSSEIEFKARDRSGPDALALAESMRDSYLSAAATAVVETRESRLDDIVLEAGQILVQMEELQATAEVTAPPGATEEDLARLDVLESLVNGLTGQLTKLEIDLVLASAGNDRVGTPAEVQQEIDLVEERLAEANAEIAAISAKYTEGQLDSGTPSSPQGGQGGQSGSGQGQQSDPVVPVGEQDLETTWTLEALQERYDDLQDEYQELFAEEGVVATPELAPGVVTDMTGSRRPVAVFVVVGALAAGLVIAGLLAVESRLRRRVYAESDVPVAPVLTTLPAAASVRRLRGRPRLLGVNRPTAWDLRMAGVRQLRNEVFPIVNGPLAVGLSATETVAAGEVRQLAIDLGRRFVAADHKVLLIDLDFEEDWPYATLAEGLSVGSSWQQIRADRSEGLEQLKKFLSRLFDTAGGTMVVMRSGRTAEDAADVYLTDSFTQLLDVCREQVDVLIGVLPTLSRVATSALPSHFGLVVITQVGTTSQPEIMRAAQSSSVRRSLLGAVVLTGSRKPGDQFRRLDRAKRSSEKRKAAEPDLADGRSESRSVESESELPVQAS